MSKNNEETKDKLSDFDYCSKCGNKSPECAKHNPPSCCPIRDENYDPRDHNEEYRGED